MKGCVEESVQFGQALVVHPSGKGSKIRLPPAFFMFSRFECKSMGASEFFVELHRANDDELGDIRHHES